MQSQQKAESDLLRVYGRLVSLTLILIILAVIGFKYFATMPQLAARSVELEHTRFLNVLAMVRSQWLSLGKPQQMRLDWEVFNEQSANNDQTSVLMSVQGWPQPSHLDDQSCQLLWQQLMGQEAGDESLTGSYFTKDNSCRYRSKNGDSIGYQLNSGRVIFLTSS
ncbi:MSHA biogenesis protein MshF [Shewanella sp. GD03713]|uniref:MSHA biogenesis protein MshF n=1 Tax=Shewanella sp. GD03713 TaxID=2975372 RepID=UPI0024480AFE|nr:MSHA biogenesis protein MshF [Shewanella sp. GD03713]MDH1471934.1 MSHA biogenesis protein MshF [Shewanella sp. GD03713]